MSMSKLRKPYWHPSSKPVFVGFYANDFRELGQTNPMYSGVCLGGHVNFHERVSVYSTGYIEGHSTS